MPRNILTESVAWATLDQYIRNNPKPRMLPRARHRAKMWLTDFIGSNIILDGHNPKEAIQLRKRDIEQMLLYTQRYID